MDKIFSSKSAPNIAPTPVPKISKKDENITPQPPSKSKDKLIQAELDKIAEQNTSTQISDKISQPKISDEAKDEILRDETKLAPEPKTLPKGARPKLAIIMDDISTKAQIQKIKALPIKVTPSIFPPAKNFKSTPQLARGLKHFAIHLPMEAVSFKHDVRALKVGESYASIEKFVDQIRSDFPHAKFINNHTGSKFTADAKSMSLLLRALSKHGFYFVDSRTIGNSKAKNAVREQNMRYAFRDVFIDNVDEVQAVRKMLKKAVAVAKKRGFAIAIGHPRKSTFVALGASADILDAVDLVYLDEIYEYYK